jgi:hypothetical protein
LNCQLRLLLLQENNFKKTKKSKACFGRDRFFAFTTSIIALKISSQWKITTCDLGNKSIVQIHLTLCENKFEHGKKEVQGGNTKI